MKGVNVVLNDVLQAKFSQSVADLGRFTLNSTAGLVGIIDVAQYAGLEQSDEDFDQTLAVWGVPQGSYLVLPLVGPMTIEVPLRLRLILRQILRAMPVWVFIMSVLQFNLWPR